MPSKLIDSLNYVRAHRSMRTHAYARALNLIRSITRLSHKLAELKVMEAVCLYCLFQYDESKKMFLQARVDIQTALANGDIRKDIGTYLDQYVQFGIANVEAKEHPDGIAEWQERWHDIDLNEVPERLKRAFPLYRHPDWVEH